MEPKCGMVENEPRLRAILIEKRLPSIFYSIRTYGKRIRMPLYILDASCGFVRKVMRVYRSTVIVESKEDN